VKPDGIEEFTRRWEAYFPGRYTQIPGFKHAHVGCDRASNAVVAVTVWDSKPDEAVIASHVAEFRP
jgi:heme-degrading monooxygenase HmoA